MTRALPVVLLLAFGFIQSPPAPRVPGIDDLLNLQTVAGVRISPDGKWVAYGVTSADFDQDAFVTQIWVAPSDGSAKPYQLTRGAKSSTGVHWAPDSHWIGFVSSRAGDKAQVFAIRPDGGEAVQLTKSEAGVDSFDWSPDGGQIAFTAGAPDSGDQKARKEQLGEYTAVHRDYAFVQLWTATVADAMRTPSAGTMRTHGDDMSVDGFSWSPDHTRLAFAATKTPDLIDGGTSDIYVLTLKDDSVRKVVSQPGPDSDPIWAPDGTRLAFQSAMGRADFFHANSRIAVVSADGGAVRSLTDSVDEDPGLTAWAGNSIYFQALQKTTSHLFAIDVTTGKVRRVSQPDALIGGAFTVSVDGSRVAFSAASPTSLSEVFVADAAAFSATKLTTMSDQLAPLIVGTREVVSWRSKDGTTIEGVLVKPKDFSPATKYPLLVVTHGGPTGIDRPTLLETRYYPVDAWVGRGALVLKVNYRGSAGYGQAFRQLNVRNLGVGDTWDVVSGVENLVQKGWVDPKRVGCMGWSQGGYISAFLTTSTTTCAAVSVGAGISDWATYYYNTDITPFTRQYLGGTPVDDPAIYAKTSPMTYIAKAATPTLIQHGENDRRVPIPNGYELRQGLEDRGVPVEMMVYKGFGHGITKPKSQRAVMRHNFEWFNHYLWNDPVPDFVTPVKAPPKVTDSSTHQE